MLGYLTNPGVDLGFQNSHCVQQYTTHSFAVWTTACLLVLPQLPEENSWETTCLKLYVQILQALARQYSHWHQECIFWPTKKGKAAYNIKICPKMW